MLLPISGVHRLEVQIDQSEGLAGYGCPVQPVLQTMTNAFGQARVRVFAGGQAGLLRVRLTVSPTETSREAGPSVTHQVEVVVRPDGGAADVENPNPPRLVAVPGGG